MGRSDDLIKTLISSSDDDQADYVIGLTFIAFVVIIVTILWLLVVSIFACVPSSSVGFLSGREFHKSSRHATPIRVSFILSALLWITATVLTVTKGIDHLQGTMQTVQTTNSKVSQLGMDGAEITQNFTQLGVEAADVRDTLMEDLVANFCPTAESQDRLQEATGIDFVTQKEQVAQYLTELSDFSRDKSETIQDGLKKIQSGTERIDTTIETVRSYTDEYVSLSIIIPWIIVPAFLLMGVILSSVSKLPSLWEYILNWIFLPVLVLQTIISATIASVSSVLAAANSDFCSPSTSFVGASDNRNSTLDGPQLTLMYIAESLGLDETGRLILRYYISNCRGADPFNIIIQYQQEYLPVAVSSLNELSENIGSVGVETIQAICNTGTDDDNFQGLINLIARMRGILETLQGDINRVLELLKCQDISPVINDALDDGVCYYAIAALAWCVICFSVITLLGLVMITFRSSFLRSVEEDIEDDGDEYKNVTTYNDRRIVL